VELEAGRKRRNPYLPHRRSRRNHKLARRLLEQHVQHSALFLRLEPRPIVFLKPNQMLHQRVESNFGQTAEFQFVQHGYSLSTPGRQRRSASFGAESRAELRDSLMNLRLLPVHFRFAPFFFFYSRETCKPFTAPPSYFGQITILGSGGMTMRVLWVAIGILAVTQGACCGQTGSLGWQAQQI